MKGLVATIYFSLYALSAFCQNPANNAVISHFNKKHAVTVQFDTVSKELTILQQEGDTSIVNPLEVYEDIAYELMPLDVYFPHDAPRWIGGFAGNYESYESVFAQYMFESASFYSIFVDECIYGEKYKNARKQAVDELFKNVKHSYETLNLLRAIINEISFSGMRCKIDLEIKVGPTLKSHLPIEPKTHEKAICVSNFIRSILECDTIFQIESASYVDITFDNDNFHSFFPTNYDEDKLMKELVYSPGILAEKKIRLQNIKFETEK